MNVKATLHVKYADIADVVKTEVSYNKATQTIDPGPMPEDYEPPSVFQDEAWLELENGIRIDLD